MNVLNYVYYYNQYTIKTINYLNKVLTTVWNIGLKYKISIVPIIMNGSVHTHVRISYIHIRDFSLYAI